MLRILGAALMLLAASACTVGLPSAIDAAPFEARTATAPLPDGYYCPLDDDDESGELVVRNTDADGEASCSFLTWQAARRTFAVQPDRDDNKYEEIALAELGEGLLLVQLRMKSKPGDEAPFPFTLMTAVAHGGALGVVPLPSDDKVLPFAARYPGVGLTAYKQPLYLVREAPADGPDAGKPVPPEPDHFYISSGAPEDIRHLARDITLALLPEAARAATEKPKLRGLFFPVLVRDQPGLADHPPSAEQLRDIDALAATFASLKAN